MRFGKFLVGICAVLVIASGAQAVSLMPLSTEVDESGFGTLVDSLSVPYTGGGFMGTLDSRVYVDAVPATEVTFVWDLQVSLALTGVSDLTLAAILPQYDLRIGEIIGGTTGYVTSTTANIPDAAEATNNFYPTADVVDLGWIGTNELLTNDRAVVYVTTTGAVDIGEVNAQIQDGSVANATVLAPVDNPGSPDLNVPEPATLALLGIGLCFWTRRRR